MKKPSSRLLSGLLALIMAFTMTSVSALAASSDVAVSIPDGENLSLVDVSSGDGNTTTYNVVSSIAGYNPYNFSLNVVPKSNVTVTVVGQNGAEVTQEGTLEGNTTYWLVTPATSGASSVKITASTGHIYVVNCNAPSGAARSGSGIYAFMPAPGQFTNEGANTGGWGDAYGGLTDEQKGYITVGDYKNYNALVERLSKLTPTSAGVISKNPDEEAASEVIGLISAIGTVTKDSGDKIQAARSAYNKLSDSQKKLVSNYNVLTEAEAAFAKLNHGGLAFTDVKESDYFYDAVKWAVEKSITSGTTATTFSPNDACTRAQMVAFLWRAAGSPEPTSKTNPFIDVTEDAYYYKALLWAIENGITKGTAETTFSPDAACTRGQMAAFLYRNAKSPAVTGSSAFTDVSSSDYYSDAVTWAAQTGVTKGTTETTFSPNAACTRAQMVSFLYRYLAK